MIKRRRGIQVHATIPAEVYVVLKTRALEHKIKLSFYIAHLLTKAADNKKIKIPKAEINRCVFKLRHTRTSK